jgi:tetratricopeptide (TPR) repeat protein
MSAAALELVRQGFALHQAGRVGEASALYDRALALSPGLFDALHLRGVAACQAGRHGEGLPFLERAVAARPGDAAARGNLVLARFGVARALREAGRLEEALAAYDALVALAPEHAAGQFNRANLLRALGRLEEAVTGYDAALAARPGDAPALLNRGGALLALGRGEAALADFTQAAALAPEDPVPVVNRGAALRSLGRRAEALACAEAAVARWPGHAPGWDLLGVVLGDLKRREAALVALERAVALAPEAADVRGHLAGTLRDLGRHEAALAEYDVAVARDGSAGHLAGRAGVLMDLGRGEAALAGFAAAVARDPGDGEAHAYGSLALLAMGRWREGWAEYEWRGRMPGSLMERFGPGGRWRGKAPVAGRRVFLFWEQGLGDTLQFLRFVPLVRALGAQVTVSVQDALVPLVRGFVDGVEVVGEAARPAPGDLHCPIMSLPLALGHPGFASAGGYLAADPARVAAWRAVLPGEGRPRVGVVWSGNPLHANDRNRSLPFPALGGLLEADVEWLCLQKEVRAEERAAVAAEGRVRFVGEDVSDFADTAALAALCDLVISVDTSVAHLAGAMGRPVWLLVPTPADWRWGTEGDGSPWYSGMRLFRRGRGDVWDGVLAQVRMALEAWRATRR